MSCAPSPAPLAISPITLKIPPFWPADPEIWFAQVKAQFTTRKITTQRFDHTEVRDYDSLKKELIRPTTAPEQRRLQRLFTTEDLGDGTPSQLLRRMKQLLGDKAYTADPSFLRELFLQRLPSNVRMVLESVKETEELESLAVLADRVAEVSSPSVSSIENSQLSTEVEYLRAEITDLKSLVKSLPQRHQQSQRQTPSPAPSTTAAGLCWYHARFAAAKCTHPCSWNSGNGRASP